MDKRLYTKKPVKPPWRRKKFAMYSLSEDWELGEKERGWGWRWLRMGFCSIFLWVFYFFNFFISYFKFSASETLEGVFLLFMPRLFF